MAGTTFTYNLEYREYDHGTGSPVAIYSDTGALQKSQGNVKPGTAKRDMHEIEGEMQRMLLQKLAQRENRGTVMAISTANSHPSTR